MLRTNNTTLVAGRFVGQIGEYARLGFNLANSHQSNTLTDRLAGNPFSGLLTVGQNRTIDLVQIVLRDDSPEDEVGGAAFSSRFRRDHHLQRRPQGAGQGHWL